MFGRLVIALVVLAAVSASADEGKLLATGGISQVEGAGGGGLVPWALISGYETEDGVGVTAHETYVSLHDFTLQSPGIAIGLYDRLEISYAADLLRLDNNTLLPAGLQKGRQLHQDVYGAKLRLIGDAVYDQDSWLPQIAAGLHYKRSHDADVLRAVGAKSDSGVDFYLSGTKLLLDYSLLADATVRFTKANQYGLLGFGGPNNDAYQAEFEGSLAYLLSKHLAVGGELRMKPNNLSSVTGESTVFDLFAAYFFTKNVSLTGAYVDLGRIADVRLPASSLEPHDQTGAYLSLQLSY